METSKPTEEHETRPLRKRTLDVIEKNVQERVEYETSKYPSYVITKIDDANSESKFKDYIYINLCKFHCLSKDYDNILVFFMQYHNLTFPDARIKLGELILAKIKLQHGYDDLRFTEYTLDGGCFVISATWE